MKRNYLLSVIVMGLIVLSLYSTYAMFTETIETDEIINMDASLIPLESKIIEYEQITINGNQAKSIMVNISNSTESNLYYGVWYEMVNPTSINSNIEIAKLTSSTDSTQGQINVGIEKNVKIVIKNTGSSSITVNIGVGYSETNSLDLPINRYVITNEIQGKYIINTSVTYGSTTTPTKIVDVGNSTSIVVKPNTGYKYKSVSCTNAEASYNTGNNTLTLTNITDDVSCTVTNEIIKYNVTAKASTGGTVSGTSSKTVNYNGSTTFTVKPNTGYKYSSVSCPSGITGSYSTSTNTLTVSNVKASGTCTVNFSIKKFTVTAKASTGGTVSGTSSKTVNYNGSTTFTVKPNTGYRYNSVSCPSGITGSYSTSTNILTVSNVKASGTCTVNFTKKTYTVRVSVTNGTSSPTSRSVSHGSSTTFTVTPNSGYEFESLSCTGGSYNASTKVLTVSNVTSTRTCTIKFKESSVANAPDLLTGLIPIMYYNGNWVKANSNNTGTYKWYDYSNQMWANAVLVSDSSRATYESASIGTTINESDVLAYYVWVPRYKYKLFNATKTAGTDSYNARTTGIDIVFESGTGSTGTVSCTVGTDGNESCTGATNEAYYTHPAFTFGSTELTGIWVGKFELTGSTTTPTIKPNVSSLRSINVSTISTTIAKISGSSNTYGVNSSEADSHMMKNMEWGAVAYLSNSKYGRCPNGRCTEIGINNNSSYITGCGAAPGSSESSSCNAYTTETGMLASTTGNVYGIYDMSGGTYEYVMGNIVSNDGSTMMSGYSTSSNSGYNGIVYARGSYTQYSSGIAYPDSKYYDKYPFSTSDTAGTRGHLGDATSEVVVSGYTGNKGWNWDSAYFVRSASTWFMRGGYYGIGSNAGAFYFGTVHGNAYRSETGRAVLVRD